MIALNKIELLFASENIVCQYLSRKYFSKTLSDFMLNTIIFLLKSRKSFYLIATNLSFRKLWKKKDKFFTFYFTRSSTGNDTHKRFKHVSNYKRGIESWRLLGSTFRVKEKEKNVTRKLIVLITLCPRPYYL